MRWLAVLFWCFIGIMLIKSVYDHESRRQLDAQEHPGQQHFFFTQPGSPSGPPPVAGANVQQTHFEVQANTPGPGSFTCLVTVKNLGLTKAENVQVHVRPYKGPLRGVDDNRPPPPLTDSDPLSQYGSWVSFPDLAPGESNTESVVFLTHPIYYPGNNPKPEIIFETAKAQP